jgi:hypothetical protein
MSADLQKARELRNLETKIRNNEMLATRAKLVARDRVHLAKKLDAEREAMRQEYETVTGQRWAG